MKNIDELNCLFDEDDVVVVTFVSRNKDNRSVENFKPRHKSRLFKVKHIDDIDKEFDCFVESGVPGELSRAYISVNARDESKVQKKLTHKLIDEEIKLTHIDSIIASLAAQSDCAITKKWIIDVDSLDSFDDVLYDISNVVGIECIINSINGKHIITERGFDSRELLNKYSYVEILRDGNFLYAYKTK